MDSNNKTNYSPVRIPISDFEPIEVDHKDIAESFATHARVLYKDELIERRLALSSMYRLLAIGIGYLSRKYNFGCYDIAKKYNIEPKDINQSVLFASLIREHQDIAMLALGILFSGNQDATEELLSMFERYATSSEAFFKTFIGWAIESEKETGVVKVDESFFFRYLPLEIDELLRCDFFMIWLNRNQYNYEGGITEQLLNMYINADTNGSALNTIGVQEPAIPDRVDDVAECLIAKFGSVLLNDRDQCYHNFISVAQRYNYSLGCDCRVLISELADLYPDACYEFLASALTGVMAMYPSKLIRYNESPQARELIDVCIVGDLLISLLLRYKDELGDKVSYLQNQVSDLKSELSKERKTEKDLEKSIDEYKIRTATAEAAFASKEKELLKRIKSLEDANKKLTRENTSLQKKIAEKHETDITPDAETDDELIESSEDNRLELPPYEEMVDALKSLPIVIVGGHDNWVAAMKRVYPDWTYIREHSSQKTDVFKNASIIVFNTEHMNHGLFYQATNNMKEDTHVYYVHRTNLKACIAEIYEQHIRYTE